MKEEKHMMVVTTVIPPEIRAIGLIQVTETGDLREETREKDSEGDPETRETEETQETAGIPETGSRIIEMQGEGTPVEKLTGGTTEITVTLPGARMRLTGGTTETTVTLPGARMR